MPQHGESRPAIRYCFDVVPGAEQSADVFAHIRVVVGDKYDRPLRIGRSFPELADQKSGIEAIFKESRQKVESLREEMAPKFDALRKTTRDRIRALLNPQQQAKFDQLAEKWEAGAKRWHERPH